MRPALFMAATLLSAGMLSASVSTLIAADSKHRSHSSRHQPVAPAQPPARIACTQVGCQPIPGSCMPVPGRTWRGTPTGYDVIVCPPRWAAALRQKQNT